jgi:hypothetical protein
MTRPGRAKKRRCAWTSSPEADAHRLISQQPFPRGKSFIASDTIIIGSLFGLL